MFIRWCLVVSILILTGCGTTMQVLDEDGCDAETEDASDLPEPTKQPNHDIVLWTHTTGVMNSQLVVGGSMGAITLQNGYEIEVNTFEIQILGSGPHDLVVGSRGTPYFRSISLIEMTSDGSGLGYTTLAGPVDLPANIAPGSTSSGSIRFSDRFTLPPGTHDLRIQITHDAEEDGPNEYKSVNAHYYMVQLNDGFTPFQLGWIRDYEGQAMSPEQVLWTQPELLIGPYVLDPNLD